AVEALLAVERAAFGRCHRLVRVVAGGTAEPALARLEALALEHLLDMADGGALFPLASGRHVDGEELFEGEPRAEVEDAAPTTEDAGDAFEVALLADGLAQGRLQVARVDDGTVELPPRQ